MTHSSPPRQPATPPRLRDGVPAALRRWWSGQPRLLLQDTAAYLLPALLPLRPEDRVLVLDDAALADALAERGHLSARPLVLARARAFRAGAAVSPAALPVADEAFTVIVAGHRLRAWDDDTLLAFLRECWRALTHNGIVVLWEVAPSRSARVNAIWRRLLPERRRGCVASGRSAPAAGRRASPGSKRWPCGPSSGRRAHGWRC